MVNSTDNANEIRTPNSKKDVPGGYLVVLAMALGLPLLGIIAKLLGF